MLGPLGHWLIHFGSGRDFHRPCYQNLVLDTIAGKQTILKLNCVNYLLCYIYRFSGSGLEQGMGGPVLHAIWLHVGEESKTRESVITRDWNCQETPLFTCVAPGLK